MERKGARATTPHVVVAVVAVVKTTNSFAEAVGVLISVINYWRLMIE